MIRSSLALTSFSCLLLKPLPARLQDHVLYTTESLRGGRRMVQLNLGYFTTEADASAVRKLAAITYPNAAVVGPGARHGAGGHTAHGRARSRARSRRVFLKREQLRRSVTRACAEPFC